MTSSISIAKALELMVFIWTVRTLLLLHISEPQSSQ